ncbi:MAG: hypothetical protein K8S99_05085 [Planctomycetes bacterium]|nr:hypothetical protein [Planctomycetota bacterium]
MTPHPHSIRFLLLFCALSLFICAPARSADSVKAKDPVALAPGTHKVSTLEADWTDAARRRAVPVKIYYPADLTPKTPAPLIIFSHGLGGTREGYEYLGRHWAEHGYICVHVQHIGSDDAVWRNNPAPMDSMRRAAIDPGNIINRPLDVSFAIDQALRLNGDEKSPLHGLIDAERIGVAGHSFGAYTTLAVAGQVFTLPGGNQKSLGDKRVKAAIAMSSPVPARRGNFAESYGPITVPCFHMTGTKDMSIIGTTLAENRRVPFDHMHLADQYLLTFKDGDHMVFSGVTRRRGDGSHDAAYHALILDSSTAFWDAYLRGDKPSRVWLGGDGFKSDLKDQGTFEIKQGDAGR